MTDEDPFERAARREQQIKHVLSRQSRGGSDSDAGELVFFGIWGLFLFGHYWLFGDGAAFFIHASIFGICAVMMLVPTMIVSALWAPFLVAHYHYAGLDTLFKIHLLVFFAVFLLFLFVSVPSFSKKERLEDRLTM